MSLDLSLVEPTPTTHQCNCPHCGNAHTYTRADTLWETNITHNLNKMFQEGGLYQILWHGDGLKAEDILLTLERGLAEMKARPDHYSTFNADNGWGTYKCAVPWLEAVIEACRQYPHAVLHCDR